jgi:ATP-dependent Lhr-like helicase
VHEGIAALLAYRIARLRPRSFTFSCNDYGLELVSPEPIDLDESAWREVLSPQRLADDLVACLNATELSRRQFREVARIAGLIIPGYPGEQRKLRHLQASSEMFFDVLTQFDPQNLLLDQARREVLDRQLEVTRMRDSLERISGLRLVIKATATLTPFGFPLWADSLREQVSSEKWSDRIKRMMVELEERADQPEGEKKKKKKRKWRGPAVRATRPEVDR